jgi:hypothetical protein
VFFKLTPLESFLAISSLLSTSSSVSFANAGIRETILELLEQFINKDFIDVFHEIVKLHSPDVEDKLKSTQVEEALTKIAFLPDRLSNALQLSLPEHFLPK